MPANIKFGSEESLFIQNTGSKISDGENEWYYIPQWFKKTGIDTFEVYSFDNLPEGFKVHLKQLRDGNEHK